MQAILTGGGGTSGSRIPIGRSSQLIGLRRRRWYRAWKEMGDTTSGTKFAFGRSSIALNTMAQPQQFCPKDLSSVQCWVYPRQRCIAGFRVKILLFDEVYDRRYMNWRGTEMKDSMTPNKAMKRTSLPVTLFACAKRPPATVGRLSRR